MVTKTTHIMSKQRKCMLLSFLTFCSTVFTFTHYIPLWIRQSSSFIYTQDLDPVLNNFWLATWFPLKPHRKKNNNNTTFDYWVGKGIYSFIIIDKVFPLFELPQKKFSIPQITYIYIYIKHYSSTSTLEPFKSSWVEVLDV